MEFFRFSVWSAAGSMALLGSEATTDRFDVEAVTAKRAFLWRLLLTVKSDVGRSRAYAIIASDALLLLLHCAPGWR